MSINAYQKTQRSAMSPTEIEQTVFRQITGRLIRAKDGSDPIARAHAINDNGALWRALLTDLVNTENKLPDDVKAGLVSLALWVGRYSALVLRGEKPIDALIEVNEQIIGGLGAQLATGQSTPAPAPAAPSPVGGTSVTL
jgi:flagellar protein FlaF